MFEEVSRIVLKRFQVGRGFRGFQGVFRGFQGCWKKFKVYAGFKVGRGKN
jgi:hypothetical protein